MKISDALTGVHRLYIDTSPLIYYVEEHPNYIKRMDAIIAVIEAEPIQAVSAVITLTEVLKLPIQVGRKDLERAYRDILMSNKTFQLALIDTAIAEQAAQLRSKYNLRTPDALHVASALYTACDAFLTNDTGIKRVTEISILVLDELELDTTP